MRRPSSAIAAHSADLLFTYGTLMRGFRLHRLLSGRAEFLGARAGEGTDHRPRLVPGRGARHPRPHRRRGLRVVDAGAVDGAGLDGRTPVSSPGEVTVQSEDGPSGSPPSTGTSGPSIAAGPFRAAITGRTRPRVHLPRPRARRRRPMPLEAAQLDQGRPGPSDPPAASPERSPRADGLRARPRRGADRRAGPRVHRRPRRALERERGPRPDRAGGRGGGADQASWPTSPRTRARPTSRPSSSRPS